MTSGSYRTTWGRWKRYHETKILRNERRVIDEKIKQIMNDRGQEDLRQKIGLQHRGGFQPPIRHGEQWTVDLFWEKDRPTPVQPA